MKSALKRIACACALLACLAPAAAAQGEGERRGAWRGLLAYERRDLRTLGGAEAASVAAHVRLLAPDMKAPGTFSRLVFKPRMLERIRTREGTRHVLLVSTPSSPPPCSSSGP